MRSARTSIVAFQLVRNEPVAYALAMGQWLCFHLSPLAVGAILKVALDRLVGSGTVSTPWLVLAALVGVEVARWTLLASAAFQWHGAYIGWMTVPRVNTLTSLATGPGPAASRLPGSPGEAVSRFRDDVQDVALLLDVWLDVTSSVVAAAIALAVLAAVEPLAAVAAVVPVGVAVVASLALGTKLRAWRRAAREATAEVTGFIGDGFGAILAVKAAGAEGAMGERFAELNRRRAVVSRRDQVGNEVVRSLGYGTGEVTVGLVLLVVAGAFRSGELGVGDIGLFASYVTVIANVPKWIGRLGAYQRQADVSIDRLAELMGDRHRGSAMRPVTTHLRHGPPRLDPPAVADDGFRALTVRGLVVAHPGSGRGVAGVDLDVRAGELVVVTGPVGAGKSSLLRGVLGLVDREAGEIRWNGRAVDEPATYLVPPRVAYLPQVPRLFSEALADTILLGHDGDALLDALWLACLDEDLAAMPDGLDTVIGPRGLRLSGGQVQRAGAARALVRRPQLLVVDDLSSALDLATEQVLWERIRAADPSAATLLVSHRPHVLDRADRVLVLEHGHPA